MNEKTAELLKLIAENPDLPVVPVVSSEFSAEYGYWLGCWSEARVDEYWLDGERGYFKSDDYDELVGDWVDNNYENYLHLTGNELTVKAENIVDGYNWVKAIIVYIEPS